MPEITPESTKTGHLLGVEYDGDGGWIWYLLKRSDTDPDRMESVAGGEGQAGYDTYEDAAHNGLVALARADGQPLEDERVDPVDEEEDDDEEEEEGDQQS